MFNGDYDFNGDGKLDNNEREFMFDDLDRELNGNYNYHFSGFGRKRSKPIEESGEWKKKDTMNWITVVILFASIGIGLFLTLSLNTKSGEGIKYMGLTMGIGFLICSFIEKGKMKKFYLILSILLSAGALLMFLLDFI